jgi:uncharacterized protein YbjT (DUF2867 family)
MTTYLVTGATGKQGGAVVEHLLAAGARIHAVVRDLNSEKSQALASKGVKLFQGTFEEPEPAFRDAAAGCSGIFLNLCVFDPTIAHPQATAILAACRAGGGPELTTVVLSSTTRVDQWSSQSFRDATTAVDPFLAYYYGAKAGVETAVREAGFKHHTILRPGVLHYDYLLPFVAMAVPNLPRSAEVWHSLDSGVTMPHTDENDVAKYAAAALLDPEKFSGEEFPLASENLHGDDVARIVSKVSGLDIKAHKRAEQEVKETNANGTPTQKFELLQNALPEKVDTEAVEAKFGIKLATLEQYMVRKRELLLDSLPPRSEGKF